MALAYSTGLVQSLFGAGPGLVSALAGFVIDIYDGSSVSGTGVGVGGRPLVADSGVPQGNVLLGTISLGGAPTTGDPAVYSLHFMIPPEARYVDKVAAEDWQFTAVGAGTATWFRLRQSTDAGFKGVAGTGAGGASLTALRIDGSIDTGGAPLNTANAHLSNTTVAVGNIYTMNRFRLTWPV
jgi:hypothetical protein